MKFEELNLKPELVASLKRLGLEEATEVQQKAVPMLMTGKDVVVRSKTGSGKTFAFLLPILQNMSPDKKLQALILTPTRELAGQIEAEVRKLDRTVSTVLLYGGVAINPQIDKLARGAQIVVATPGRVLDHIQRRTVDFSTYRV